jgi:glycosyltransferase involved in cell wall biosynthesis
MPNIGVVVDNEFNTDIRVRKEVSVLARQGFSVFVLCFGFDGKSLPEVDGVTCHRIPMRKKIFDITRPLFNTFPFYEWMWTREISRFITRYDIEVLHAHDLYMARAARNGIIRSGKEIPLILDLHENYPVAIQAYNWTKGWLRSRLVRPGDWVRKEKSYLAYADKLIVLSEHFKKTLLERYDWLRAENVVAYPNVIDLRRFEAFTVTPGLRRSETVTLFYFGVVAERRGIFSTIDALRVCLAEKLDVELLIVGPVDKADRERFEKEAADPTTAARITYVPWIEVSELPDYLYRSDICLSPLVLNAQHESGVANKLYQYMFGKRPIIVSNCRPQVELVTSASCGLAYTDQASYVAAIRKLVTNPELRREMGKNGFHALYERFDNIAFEQQLLGVYQSLSLASPK